MKRERDCTEALCADAGIRYMPIVYSAQGGVEKRSAKALDQIHRLVSTVQSQPLAEVQRRFDIEMSLILVRAGYRAYARRAAARRGEDAQQIAQRSAVAAVLSVSSAQ